MRAVVQRVSRAVCRVDGTPTGEIGKGFVVFLGCAEGDDEAVLEKLMSKIMKLRIFRDEEDRMNLSLADVGGSILLISQFTLLADARRGNRPSFSEAMRGEDAERLYEKAISIVRQNGIRCGTGRFGAHMMIEQENDGPVTIILDSDDLFC